MNEDKEILLRYMFDDVQNKMQELMIEAIRLKRSNFHLINEIFTVLRKEVVKKIYDLEQFESKPIEQQKPDSLFPTEKN